MNGFYILLREGVNDSLEKARGKSIEEIRSEQLQPPRFSVDGQCAITEEIEPLLKEMHKIEVIHFEEEPKKNKNGPEVIFLRTNGNRSEPKKTGRLS